MPIPDTVQAGDLITAQQINDLITEIERLSDELSSLNSAVNQLEKRVSQLEQQGLLTGVASLDPEMAIQLHSAGIRNLQELRGANKEDLKRKVSGVNEETADSLISDVEKLFTSPSQ